MQIKIPLPNERQKEFFLAREKFILYGGSRGGGKSWAIRWKQILRRLKYPKSKGLLLRRTFPELYRNHILEIQRELPADSYKYNDQKHTFTFNNGSVQELGSCQFEGDVYNYQGAEYDDIGIDEASQFTKVQFDNFKTNLRTVRDDIQLQMYLGSNPGNVGHFWIKNLFIDKIYEGGENPTDYKFIPARVYDNTILMKKDPDYVHQLETLPQDLRRAFLEGDWDVFAGQALTEWRRDHHIYEKPINLTEMQRALGFDWGYNDHGAAVFLARDKEGYIYQWKEIYQNRKQPEEWAEDLVTAMKLTPVDVIFLPHDCFAKQQGRDCIADVFKRIFLKNNIGTPIKRGDTLSKNSRKNGLALFHMYLSDSAQEKPYFTIHSSCQNTIRTLPSLIYDENNPEDIDKNGEDHLYDAIRVVFLEWGKPRGYGGGVKMKRPEKEPFSVNKAPDLQKILKESMKEKRDWRYR